ncbi:DUF2934 domain-containing protein [Amorphus coralli]|uniref:DUF2934 domain-containing protein n=1 Tax=Amorphus coralli TaxID=340680 RepID=UPI000367B022|nr:DUF2934 domain-containing protein [Amorphus coralli]
MADVSRLPEQRVREKAYQIWVEEGRPEGRELDHWERASELVAIEQDNDATLVPRETGVGDDVEPPEALENLGEFPELVDQGTGETAPSRDRAEATATDKPAKPARKR